MNKFIRISAIGITAVSMLSASVAFSAPIRHGNPKTPVRTATKLQKAAENPNINLIGQSGRSNDVNTKRDAKAGRDTQDVIDASQVNRRVYDNTYVNPRVDAKQRRPDARQDRRQNRQDRRIDRRRDTIRKKSLQQ